MKLHFSELNIPLLQNKILLISNNEKIKYQITKLLNLI